MAIIIVIDVCRYPLSYPITNFVFHLGLAEYKVKQHQGFNLFSRWSRVCQRYNIIQFIPLQEENQGEF